jgi:hypothetical protein
MSKDTIRVAAGQEAIQMVTGDYLDTLERMVTDGRKRHDPTLAIALSIEMLGLLVAEVRRARTPAAPSADLEAWRSGVGAAVNDLALATPDRILRAEERLRGLLRDSTPTPLHGPTGHSEEAP